MPTPRLLTIPFSHYCEKARWAADYQGYAYREDSYIPGAHFVPARRSGGRTLPILVTADETFTDSTDILHYLDTLAPREKRLFPEDPAERREVSALEELFDSELGKATRVHAYHHGLPNAGSFLRVLAPSMSPFQRVAFRFVLPVVGKLIERRYRISDATALKAEGTIRRIFDTIGERLRASGGRYLVGDRFSAADLTFAALAAPSLMPPGHPSMTSSLDGEPARLADWVTSLRATPAGAHALRMYREHRAAA